MSAGHTNVSMNFAFERNRTRAFVLRFVPRVNFIRAVNILTRWVKGRRGGREEGTRRRGCNFVISIINNLEEREEGKKEEGRRAGTFT